MIFLRPYCRGETGAVVSVRHSRPVRAIGRPKGRRRPQDRRSRFAVPVTARPVQRGSRFGSPFGAGLPAPPYPRPKVSTARRSARVSRPRPLLDRRSPSSPSPPDAGDLRSAFSPGSGAPPGKGPFACLETRAERRFARGVGRGAPGPARSRTECLTQSLVTPDAGNVRSAVVAATPRVPGDSCRAPTGAERVHGGLIRREETFGRGNGVIR